MSDWFALFVGWVKDQCWITLDVDTINFISGGIHLSNDEVIDTGKSLGELIPNWSELLAVTTPWCVKFNKNIFSWIFDNFIKFSSNNDNNITLGFRGSSGFKMGFNRSIFNSSDKFTNLISGNSRNISFVFEFLHIGWKKSSNGWVIFFSNSNEFSKFSLDLIGRSSIREKNLSLEFVSSFFESFSEKKKIKHLLSKRLSKKLLTNSRDKFFSLMLDLPIKSKENLLNSLELLKKITQPLELFFQPI
jgi:hypothetical protein